MPWQRPADPEYPRVYARLERTRRAQAPRVETFLVQDLPPEEDERAIQLLVANFLRDEPTCKSLGPRAQSDPLFIKEWTDYWTKCLAHRTSLVCYRIEQDGTRRIVGLNACGVACKDDPAPDLDKLQSKEWRQALDTVLIALKICDAFGQLGVDRYLGGSGLLLLPEYRGMGLAAEILRAREPLCRAAGLQATCTVFTALASQKVAEKCGFKTLGELPYDSLSKYGYQFPDIESPSAKVMALKYS